MMREFAGNGAKHLVLCDTFLKMMGDDYTLLPVLKAQLAQAGLDFVDAHAPFRDFGDLFIPDKHDWKMMIARHKLALLFVNEFGVDTCTFHVGSKYYPEHTVDEHREALYRSLDELLPVAEKYGITLCLENLVRPLSTADDLISYMKKYDSPNLGVCLDVGHANLKEKGRSEPQSEVPPLWQSIGREVYWEEHIAEKLQPYVVNCHVHDNRAAADDHDLPGTGSVDWKRIVQVLLHAPRLKNIQSEVLTSRRNITVREVCENIHRLFGVEG